MVIASEGEKTELRYFSIFRSTRLQIKLIPSEDGCSSPGHISSNLENFAREFDLNDDDQLWLVIDRDRWQEATLSEVAQLLLARGWQLALSNPCFELWLALHFDAALPDVLNARTLNEHLRAVLGGFNKAKFDPAPFADGVRSAETKARAMDIETADRWPQQAGTRVYRITEQFT